MSILTNTDAYLRGSITREWNLWCRLCAKADVENVDINMENEQQKGNSKVNYVSLINKFFKIQIIEGDELSHVVCSKCLSTLKSLEKFASHIDMVQKMFKDLKCLQDDGNIDSILINEKYRVFHEEVFINHPFEEQNKVTIIEKVSFADVPSVTDIAQSVIYEEQTDIAHEKFEVNSKAKDPLNQENDTEKLVNVDIEQELEKEFLLPKSNEKEICVKYIKDVLKNKYKCNKCLECFPTVSTYNIHMRKLHGMTGRQLCAKERKKSNTKSSNVKDTTWVKKPPYSCPNCNESFHRKILVTNHMKSVHDVKGSYICEECGEILGSKSTLRDHFFIHSKDAPFKCKDCDKRFKTKSFLTKHRSIHGDKHICAECGLQLSSRATLYCHLLVHSDAKPHKCDYCGRAFKRSKTLKNHLLVHSGLKPYSCNFCDKSFSNGTTCRQHKKNIHPKEFAAEEASGEKASIIGNIPKLTVLKEVTRTAKNLTPVASKPRSGNFSIGNTRLLDNESNSNRQVIRKRKVANDAHTKTETEDKNSA